MRYMVQAMMKELGEKELGELMAVVAAQEAFDGELIAQGVQEGRAIVAANRSTAWKVLNCESEDEVQEILLNHPTYELSSWHVTQVLSEEDNVPE